MKLHENRELFSSASLRLSSSFLHHPLYPILWSNDCGLFYVIGCQERGGELGVCPFGIPFHLKEGELAVALLYVIYLLLQCRAPEIAVGIAH